MIIIGPLASIDWIGSALLRNIQCDSLFLRLDLRDVSLLGLGRQAEVIYLSVFGFYDYPWNRFEFCQKSILWKILLWLLDHFLAFLLLTVQSWYVVYYYCVQIFIIWFYFLNKFEVLAEVFPIDNQRRHRCNVIRARFVKYDCMKMEGC